VIAETGWPINRQLGATAEAALHKSAAAGEIRVEPLSAADWSRTAALTIQYAEQHLGGVDNSFTAVAENSALPGSAHSTDARSASSALSTSPASSCFRKPSPRSHDCILAGVHGSAPRRAWTSPAAPFIERTRPRLPAPCPCDIRGGRVVGVVSEQKTQVRRGCPGVQLQNCTL